MKITIINDLKAKYKFIDNKAKITLLLIHGFTSSVAAFDPLYKSKKFNMLAFNYPDGEHNVKELAAFHDEVVSKIKGKVIVVGHSLGGAITANMKNQSNIKQFIFVAALTEILTKTIGFDFFEKQNQKVNTWAIKAAGKMLTTLGQEGIGKFLNPPSGFRKVTKENVSNGKWLKETLTPGYISKAKKSIAYIGTEDVLFDDLLFVEFMDKVGIKTYVLKDATHNPFTSTGEINTLLEERIPFKKRWRKNILKID